MKIFRALFGNRKAAPVPAAAPAPIPISHYYAYLLKEIHASESVAFLQAHAAHPSGYAREAVLRRSVELARPELLPVVAERLNDWVPQVQRAARTAIMTLLPFAPAEQLLAVLPLILRLHSAGRGDYADWLERFEHALIQTVNVSDICAAAGGPDLKLARASVHLLDKHRLLETPALIELILARDDDIVLAHRALELCVRLAPESQIPIYRGMMRMHFGAVRTIALRRLLAMHSSAGEALAIAALLDAQSSVRRVATDYLLAAGIDVRAYYQQLLQQGTHTARRVNICLAALAALHDITDVELVKSFQTSDYPSVRMAARIAWFKLAEQDKDAVALAAMGDVAVGARKLAIQLVRKQGAYIAFSAILAQLEDGGDAVFLLRLAETNKWNWLECLARIGLQRGVETAQQLGLDESLSTWLSGTQWYDHADKEQLLFLSSTPVIAFFGQLLRGYPQRLTGLLKHLQASDS